MSEVMIESGQQHVEWTWRDVELEDLSGYATEEPTEPKLGTMWRDREHECLYAWDSEEWVAVPLD